MIGKGFIDNECEMFYTYDYQAQKSNSLLIKQKRLTLNKHKNYMDLKLFS